MQKDEYFWDRDLHNEFIKIFTICGKNWKTISLKIIENGMKHKN